uniref:uncharacterized protein LOC122609490 n=1 Tax=Erigeron canadensis TaxID=72917 RepID=UPI001CB90D28|nr:uncharacterized protein LOC122609490 [Erigeron canadensis]
MTFKYVFWAFGPAINAFQMCRPVISVDGTHLKGSYKGNMLVAVAKDANNSILPIAFTIVDEETVDSWCWFFEQLRCVVQDKQLCVISDRHRGIIHLMKYLEKWKEPFAYHRFCLRHVWSNLMSRFKNLTLKRLCWAIGSTTQERKFSRYKREIEALNPSAWKYLEEIDKSQWCLAFDNNLRWGSLTTNISESFNNVLRGARQLPIRACIGLTFKRTVQLFKRYTMVGLNCKTSLPPNIWKIYRKVDTLAQSHHIEEFDYTKGVYRIVTARKTNGHGGNVQIVYYHDKKCTCGKWQAHRFPCSHAITICRQRRDNPLTLVNGVYGTSTFKCQYESDFVPLLHNDYWTDPGWKIQADYSKLVTSRGRRRQSRIENEMDQRHPNEPRKCGICRLSGHNKRNCPKSQPR